MESNKREKSSEFGTTGLLLGLITLLSSIGQNTTPSIVINIYEAKEV